MICPHSQLCEKRSRGDVSLDGRPSICFEPRRRRARQWRTMNPRLEGGGWQCPPSYGNPACCAATLSRLGCTPARVSTATSSSTAATTPRRSVRIHDGKSRVARSRSLCLVLGEQLPRYCQQFPCPYIRQNRDSSIWIDFLFSRVFRMTGEWQDGQPQGVVTNAWHCLGLSLNG